ncbi:xylose isomerase, partial [Muricauda sp. SYSU M86414]|nr:xylose isomerase [Muricauda sp. SYSU M86414]
MKRREFVRNKIIASTAIGLGGAPLFAMESQNTYPLVKNDFQLKYAPHLGMFKESAGDDPIDQLNFMA